MLDFRIGFFLGIRQIQRANPWTTALIITVIVFTYLNLVAVSGILIGIVEGALRTTRIEAVGDVILKPLEGESRIKNTDEIIGQLASYPEIEAFSPRYSGLATIEANYTERRDLTVEPDIIAVNITGIDVEHEDQVTGLRSLIGEGEYFDPDESGYIILGKYNIDRYADKFGDAFQSLDNVYPGDTVRVTVGERSEEFIVKGVIDSKIDLVSMRVFMPEREFRRIFDRADHNANEILVRINENSHEDAVKSNLVRNGYGSSMEIETFSEGIPKFITDVVITFDLVGLLIGSIGIIVAAITIFIVVFINALSRQRQIGILKAIGITGRSIAYAYVTQAAIYAIIGSAIGVLITLFLLVPYFKNNPIDFPFGDAALSVTPEGIVLRCVILLVTTLVAGFIPAWLIVRINTLNSILGRKS